MKKLILTLLPMALLTAFASMQAAELTLEQTQIMALAAEAKAKEMGVNVAVTILDQHGNDKLFFRMDGASRGGINGSRMKANTASSFRISSRQLAERNLNEPNHAFSNFPGVILLAGGLPINFGGEVVGAIGVGGSTADKDEIIAQAAIDAINCCN